MSFTITGLAADDFAHLFGLPEAELAARSILRRTATAKPGFPCRITLEDAEPGETLLLLNHESHTTDTPYRSAYAIYVRENAQAASSWHDTLPPVMRGRPLALRLFDETGMLVGADLSLDGDPTGKIQTALAREDVAYIDVHNAAHGCFSARVNRS